MQRVFNKFYYEQRGSAAVVTGIFMVILIGISAFVLDFGVSYETASRLQNSLDSAALAALQELPAENTASAAWSAAENTAVVYASLNDFEITPENIRPVYKNDIATNAIIGINITKSVAVEYNFARVLGIDSATVTRTATAGLVPAGGIKGAVPLSITDSGLSNAIAANVVSGLRIKCSSNTSDIGIDCTEVSGWFGALRFEGTGASIYSDLLANGYSGSLFVGQELEMENGNMSGPTMDGFTTRYNKCKDGCTAESYLPDCPKLVYVPVVEVISGSCIKIVSFATFFLTECGGSGKDSYIKATYIKDTVIPDSAAGESGRDFGLYVGKLLE